MSGVDIVASNQVDAGRHVHRAADPPTAPRRCSFTDCKFTAATAAAAAKAPSGASGSNASSASGQSGRTGGIRGWGGGDGGTAAPVVGGIGERAGGRQLLRLQLTAVSAAVRFSCAPGGAGRNGFQSCPPGDGANGRGTGERRPDGRWASGPRARQLTEPTAPVAPGGGGGGGGGNTTTGYVLRNNGTGGSGGGGGGGGGSEQAAPVATAAAASFAVYLYNATPTFTLVLLHVEATAAYGGMRRQRWHVRSTGTGGANGPGAAGRPKRAERRSRSGRHRGGGGGAGGGGAGGITACVRTPEYMVHRCSPDPSFTTTELRRYSGGAGGFHLVTSAQAPTGPNGTSASTATL